MKAQRTPCDRRSFFSYRLTSTWRLALIASVVFGVGLLVGYSATATAPTLIKKIAQMRSVTAPAPLAERSQFAQPSKHRVEQLLTAPVALEAVVFTDRPNYFPGEIAQITGLGFWPNEIVTLQVVHTDGTSNDGNGHEPWNVAADALGNFNTIWFVDPDDSAGSSFLLTATGNSSGIVAQAEFTDGSANLDTCENGPAGSPAPCTGEAWTNGNVNGSKGHYAEGESVPYRTILENLIAGNTYTLTIEYDTTQGGNHAFDYLTSFDRTEPTPGNNPCTRKVGNSIVSVCNPLSFLTTPIPVDPNVTNGPNGAPGGGDDITQIAGVFTLFNGNAFSVLNPGNPYTLDGTYAGNSSTSITVQFTATSSIAVIAWGGHISTRLDWGVLKSAIAINGSPYHMRLTNMTCSGQGEGCNVGQQDHQLSADAVFFPIQLTIIKETNPNNAQTKTFNYTTTGNNLGPFSLTPPDGLTPAQQVFNLTDTTTRTVTESDPNAAVPKFTLTSLTCIQTDGGLGIGDFTPNLGTRTVSISPKEGQFISCTFVNEQVLGKIIVDKVTVPGTDTTSFDFTTTYGSPFSLNNAATPNDSGFIVPGTYQVTETANPNYDTTSTCTSSLGHPADNPNSINLDAGETVTCTFTNTKRGHIIVDKVTDPSGDPQSFNFDASGGSYADFSLTDAAPPNDQTLAPGNYSVSETVPAGWDKTSSPCVSSIGDTESAAAIELDAGETVTCTFNNQKDANIIVKKETDPNGDPQVFSFTASYDADGFSLSDGQQNDSGDIDPGTYSVSETVPAGWQLKSSPCVSSKGDSETIGSISLQAGETVTCTFNNEKDSKIIVKKETDPNGDPQVFAFTASYDADGFNLSDGQQNDSGDLDPGTYSVSETVPAGWDLTSSPCVSSKGDSETIASISLQAGETVTCTFNNQKDAKIIVKKETDPNGDPQVFAFTASYDADGFSLSDGQQDDSGDLDPGTYSVSETVPAGWDLDSSPCVSSNGDSETIASISLQAGETVTCTFNNEKDANIIVKKETDPNADPQVFSFTASYDADGFSLSDGQQNDSGDLDPGTYSVSETVPAGWDLDSSPCVSSKGDSETIGSISLQAGETVTCTFNNEKDAKIIVKKETDPDGDPQVFAFTASYDADGFNLSDGQQNDSGDLDPGTYSVSETVPSYWDLTSSPCVSSNGDSETIGSISLQAGETVTCTFNNQKDAKIIVKKETDPNGDPQVFAFTASYDADGFNLSDGQQNNSGDLDPGTYSVSETVPAGWQLESSPCVSSKGDSETIGNISLQAGETVTCTFNNEKDAKIIVKKETNPDGDTTSFSFTANYDADGFSLKDGEQNNSGDLDPGTYSVSETVPAGWDLTSSPCVSSKGDSETAANISLQAGETVTCTFYNRKRASLTVEKQTNPDGASGSFTFTGTAAGTISDNGTIVVGNLVPGTYTSTENNPAPNFDLTSITCSDANSTGDKDTRTATFRLEAGESVKCVFTNTQRGTAQVVKTVSGLPPAAGQSFTFELRQGTSTVADGTTLETKNTDASGNISFTTKLVAGETYQICEWVFPGWNTNLAGDGPLFVPSSIIPPALPNPNVNNLTVCANFTVQPGQARTFTVNNSPPPGGRALTIGFWKNWASCSNSNGKGQKPMLDLALGIATANTPNPPDGLVASAQYPGALWPSYAATWYLILKGNPASTATNILPAPDCTQAVNLLNKSTIDGKKKMSSDPLFNMTAQLIAAQLNRFMGAGINGTTIMNIDRAVLLNGKYKFNGLTYTPKLTTADTNTANCLATQLDNYNNGNLVALCP